MKPIKLKNLAVFVGRFQPFHIGHYSIVEKILAEYEHLILIIGSAEKSWTEDNPWTLQEREEIIRASLPLELQERIDVVGLDDTSDDDEWGENLKNLIMPPWSLSPTPPSPSPLQLERGQGRGFSDCTLITGNEWVRSICEKQGIQTEWIHYTIDISGTKIREMIRNGEDVSQWTIGDMGE